MAAVGKSVVDARIISDLICAVEQRIDIDDWQLPEVHAWPLVRNELYRQLVARHLSSKRVTASTAWNAMARHLARSISPSAMPNPRPGAVWLISDGISYQRTPSGLQDRFCEPLAHLCGEHGKDVFRADVDRSDNRELIYPATLWGGRVLASKVAATLAARLRPRKIIVTASARLNEALRAEGAEVYLEPKALDARIRSTIRLAAYFGRIMDEYRPSALFIVSYYSVVGYALCMAARRRGIITVDVQHGVSGLLHPAYNRWSKVPLEGFELVPSIFWTWSKGEARLINEDLGRATSAHRAIDGGHPAIVAWREGWIEGVAALDQQAWRLDRRSDTQRILVTLQPGLSAPKDLARLAAAMRRLPQRSWWIRLHPMALAERPSVEAILRQTDAIYEIDSASNLPLYSLLANVDLHLTHSSSTVIEAAEFGVPSVIWSGYGADLFAAEIEHGAAIAAPDGVDLVEAIERVPLRAAGFSPSRGLSRMRDAMNEIMGLDQ